MSDLERAKLIPVSGNNDTPDMNNAIDVQFNPMSLKVNLANTLKANESQGNSRAAQFVDKSSSTLTVELVFDTTFIESAGDGDGGGSSRIEQGSDVRQQTKKIADKFMKPVESGNKMQAPSRVLFQWGSFEFVGMVQSYDETLDFFSPKGRPLRATVSLKLSEDRYQFRSNDSDALKAAQSPTLAFTGDGGAGGGDQNASPVPGGSGDGPGSWRDNALFNGIETPRLPGVASLALPSVSLSAGAGFGISGGVDIGLGASVSVSGGFDIGVSASLSASAGGGTATGAPPAAKSAPAGAKSAGPGAATPATAAAAPATTAPAFKYGNSAALGTGIPGAFHPNPKAGLKAASLQQGAQQLRAATAASTNRTAQTGAAEAAGAPRDVGAGGRRAGGVSVAALLKATADEGVGFD